MQPHEGLTAADLSRLSTTIGRLEIAQVLFKPRVDQETVEAIAKAVLSGLKIQPASVNLVADMAQLPADRIGPWAAQAWVNIVGELCATDSEMARAFTSGGGYLPSDPATIMLYRRKLSDRFFCFLWLVGWRADVGDFDNCFTVRLVVLDSVIRIEDLQAKLDGQSGGWGVLDAVVNGVRAVAAATGQRVKTIATNHRVEQAFRRRGFIDSISDKYTHTAKARSLELSFPATRATSA